MTVPELETKINEYMLLNDPGIVKLLLSFVVGCHLPLPPPWVFIVSGSSGGKTKLIQLLEGIQGYFEIDDLTANTLLSGIKRHDQSPSLLHKLPPDGFIVFKDFTTILSKYHEQMGTLMGQMRMVYDGKFVKHTGQGDEILWSGKAGLLAGVTTKIYTTQTDWADMGERFVMYHMKQPGNMELGKWIMGKKRNEKAMELELQHDIAAIVGAVPKITSAEALPIMDEQTSTDLVEIAYLTVMSRSPVERRKFDVRQRMEMKHDHEMIGRFLKQLMTLAYAMMLINDGPLLDTDRGILYKIGLDSIPMQRYMVMRALTENRLGGDINQIADKLRYPFDTVEKWVEDLVALGIVHNSTMFYGGGKKKTYSMEQQYMDIIAKFENIMPIDEALPMSEEEMSEIATFTPPVP